MKMKLDIGDVINKALDIINNSKSRKAKDYGFGIGIGFEIFVSYLEDITNRAIEIDDPIILEALINIGACKCSPEEEQDILKRVKELKEQVHHGSNND